jgi:hypothetical protein
MNEDKLYEDACKLAMYRNLDNTKDYKEAINEIYQELILNQKGEEKNERDVVSLYI